MTSRVELARKSRGITQAELAKSIGVTAKAISKYEKTGEGLGRKTIAKIANYLNYPVSFLFGGEIELPNEASVSFRARSKMTSRDRNRALSLIPLGESLSKWMEANFNLPETDIPDFSNYDPQTAATALRLQWQLEFAPIENMIATLEAHGVRVFSVSETSNDIDAFSFWSKKQGRPFVFLTTSKSAERRRMDAAHELGHLVLHRYADDTKETKQRETEANQFASAFLMPDPSFGKTVGLAPTLEQLLAAKRIWKVSAFAATYRAHQIGRMTKWQYNNTCMIMGKMGMRTREPNGIAPETSAVFEQIYRHLKMSDEGVGTISEDTGIPIDFILQLTFMGPAGVVRGNPQAKGREHAHLDNLTVV